MAKSKAPPPWRKFEIVVGQLEQLLARGNATVRCPGFVIDKQGEQRQVDVLIEVSGESRRVRIGLECRRRRKVSDQMWIEELIGRRQNLGLDAIMAVTNKPMSEPAARAAQSAGIKVLRLADISAESIAAGIAALRTTVDLHQYDVRDFTICLSMAGEALMHQLGLSPHDLRIKSDEKAFVYNLTEQYSAMDLFRMALPAVAGSRQNQLLVQDGNSFRIFIPLIATSLQLPGKPPLAVHALDFLIEYIEHHHSPQVSCFAYEGKDVRHAALAEGRVAVGDATFGFQVIDLGSSDGKLVMLPASSVPSVCQVTVVPRGNSTRETSGPSNRA